VQVFKFDQRWAEPLQDIFQVHPPRPPRCRGIRTGLLTGRVLCSRVQQQDRELQDVVLSAGGCRIGAHRILLAAVSPHLRALFRTHLIERGAGEVASFAPVPTEMSRIKPARPVRFLRRAVG
jgi:hypothetical protein